MGVKWRASERERVVDGLARHPVASGRCAALARVVYRVGKERDESTQGRQVRPRATAARYVVPKLPNPPLWGSHTFVDTHGHAVDALTGVHGRPRGEYIEAHWEYVSDLRVVDVDVDSVDPGIEEDA